MLEHVRLMIGYNRRMNGQIYDIAAALPTQQLREDRGAFFGSVLGTLNHLLVADLIWLNRFRAAFPHFTTLAALDGFPRPQRLEQILHEEFSELRAAREAVDALLAEWVERDLRAEDLAAELDYVNMKGVRSTRNFGEVLMHLFNHQTHHRGQLSTLLFQLGRDVGVTDFLLDIPDRLAPRD